MKNGTHMPWMPSVSSRGRTRTYDPRVMSPMSCQLLYPASNALVNLPEGGNNVNRCFMVFAKFLKRNKNATTSCLNKAQSLGYVVPIPENRNKVRKES